MKKIYCCFVLVLCFFVKHSVAQHNQDWEMKRQLLSRIDTFITVFNQASEFRMPGTDHYSDEVADNYRNLFLPEAKVYNEMAPSMLDGDRENPYVLKFTSLDEYLLKIKTNFSNGLRQDLLRYTVDYSKLSSGNIKVIMQKVVRGISRDGFELRNNDTISVEIKVSAKDSDLRISRILKLGSEFSVMNDRDHDFIIDSKDKCPDAAGIASYNGCPPPDRALAFIGLELNFGISVTNTLNGPVKSDLGYDQLIDQTLKLGNISPDNMQSSHFGATVQYDRFFGRKRIFGVGSGLSFQHYSTELDLNNFFVEYKALDQFGNSYRRRVFSNSTVVENIKTNYLMIPVTFKYKEKFFKKGGLYVDAGFAFSFLLSGKGKANGTFNYEALYSYSKTSGTFVYDNNTIPNDSDWIMTGNFVNANNANNSIATDSYFNAHNNAGFDVALNKSINQESSFKLSVGISLLAKAGVYYKILENAEADLGIIYLSENHSNDNSSNYKITDKSGDYSSMMNGSSKLSTQSVGISFGVKFSLQ
jgi:hypothetical protein